MFSELNNKYMNICRKYGLNIEIKTVKDPNIQRYKILMKNDILQLDVKDDIYQHQGYEKVLAWGVREALLPRLMLKTDRLLLRRFTLYDKEKCLPLLSNYEDSYMDCCRCFTEKDEAYYQRIDLFIQRETQYAVTLKQSGELIGILNVFPDESRAVDAMEIGYGIARPHQRNGYAYEMLSAALKLLQDDLLVDTVSAGALPENKASIGLLKKAGFKEEGIRHHGAWHEVLDKPVDIQYFYHDRE